MSLHENILQRLKEAHLELALRITYGYITNSTREQHGIAKSHHADAF